MSTVVLRNFLIAAGVGLLLSLQMDGPRRWPVLVLLLLWPTFGGHWVEVFFLNILRPRVSDRRPMQIFARFLTWFIGGMILMIGLKLTALTIHSPRVIPWSELWIGGVGFIGIELIAHLGLQLRGKNSFYNGLG